jgi:hypothetical protein
MNLYMVEMLIQKMWIPVLQENDGYKSTPVVFLCREEDKQSRLEEYIFSQKPGDNTFRLVELTPEYGVFS